MLSHRNTPMPPTMPTTKLCPFSLCIHLGGITVCLAGLDHPSLLDRKKCFCGRLCNFADLIQAQTATKHTKVGGCQENNSFEWKTTEMYHITSEDV